MYICLCKAVTDRQIRQAISNGTTRMRDLQRELGVCTGCGKCAQSVKDILCEALPFPPQPAYYNVRPSGSRDSVS